MSSRKLKKSLDIGYVKTHSIDPKVSMDNTEPITPKLLNKRTAHSSSSYHTQKQALDLLSYISRTCPSINNFDPQLVAVTPRKKDKKVRHGLIRGLPKLKFEKDHLCSACALGKSLKKPHKPKSEDTNQEKLYLLHMDLCGPMRVASVNGKKYILVIIEDYSRFTWVKCLRSKVEAPVFIINFLKMIQVRLKETIRRIRTDNGTEFVNQTLREYYEKVGFSHETSVARSPQQNGVVERQNRTLIEAARTMLIYAKAPLFLWAEAVATSCYT
ncbi:retrovirus-related pol polyprotein from transposon TNT 1-94 [Tanacetum coccineum]